jgi:tetratricopeptide (TPR) repeat protein
MRRPTPGALWAAAFLPFFLSGCGSSGFPALSPRAGEGFTPLVLSSPVFSADGACLAAAAGSPALRGGKEELLVWDLASGRLLGGADEFPGLVFPEAPDRDAGAPGSDPGGRFSAGTGEGLLIRDARSLKERARFVCFGNEGGEREWLSLSAGGYNTASRRGGGLLALEGYSRRIGDLAGLLHRPDLFMREMAGERAAPSGVHRILRRNPPLLSVEAAETGVSAGLSGTGLFRVRAADQGGGVGNLFLYRRDEGGDSLEGVFSPSQAAGKYRERGKTGYEFSIEAELFPGPNRFVLSAFDKTNSLESQRTPVELPGPEGEVPGAPAGKPLLHLFLGGGREEGPPGAADFFIRQRSGTLYGDVAVHPLYGEDSSPRSLLRPPAGVPVGRDDTAAVYLSGAPPALEDMVRGLAGIRARRVFLVLEGAGAAAFERLGDLFPRLFMVASGRDAAGEGPAMADLLSAAGEAAAGRYITAGDLTARRGPPAERAALTVLSGSADFPLLDRFLEPGELRVSTLFPGAAAVNDGEERIPLDFGEPLERRLPEGTYRVTMYYRNGYRETKTGELRNNGRLDLAFRYQPRLERESFQSPLPAFGVYAAELNPGGYKKIEVPLPEDMGMAPYYGAFLSGRKYFQAGDYDRAIAEYSRSIALKGDYPEAYHYRGYAYGEKGDHRRAVEDYTRAIGIRRDYGDAYFNRAYSRGERGDHEGAIADLSRVIELEPGNAAAYYRRGGAYYRRKEEDRAIEDYGAAIRLRPDYAAAYHSRGNVYYNRGDYHRAIEDLSAAIAADPRLFRAYADRGSAWMKLGDPARAGADFAAATEGG